MTDCGTTGTTIDQAARLLTQVSIIGNNQSNNNTNINNNNNTNYASQLLEQATKAVISQSFNNHHSKQQPQVSSSFVSTTTDNHNVISTILPEYLPAPQLIQQQQLQQQQHHQQAINYFPIAENASSIDVARTVNSRATSVAQHTYRQQQQQQQHQQQFFVLQQQQQQQQLLMQQQNQQLQFRQQQINLMMLQQQQQQQQQKQQQQKIENEGDITEQQFHRGHDGTTQPVSIQELTSAWMDAIQQEEQESHLDDVDNHTTKHQNYDSTTNQSSTIGANFNDLATAWAEAQSELQNNFDDIFNNDNNMWSGSDGKEENKYQFTTSTSDTTLQQLQDSNDTTIANYMEQGYREFHAGNMKGAVTAFEMELQHSDLDNATAWCMLGRCHAENDMDTLAIQCFEEAVHRDPYNIDALLALGVSYVNELNHVAALKNLKEYILNNPKFANLDITGDNDIYGASSSTTHNGDGLYMTATDTAFDDVQRLLLSALDYQMQHNRDDHNTTASVLEALGVVYNVSRDYDAAIDVLRQGCALRPNDYTLWNKLGATLANSGEHRSEEALLAYHEALQMKPKYARAWLNMAIAHSNLQQYHEAARCYLQTISINPNAVHCWSFLRIALSCLEMNDLIPATASQDIEAFHTHFDFISYNDSFKNPTSID